MIFGQRKRKRRRLSKGTIAGNDASVAIASELLESDFFWATVTVEFYGDAFTRSELFVDKWITLEPRFSPFFPWSDP